MKRDTEIRITERKPRVFWLVKSPLSYNQAGYDVYTYEPSLNVPYEQAIKVMEICTVTMIPKSESTLDP